MDLDQESDVAGSSEILRYDANAGYDDCIIEYHLCPEGG